MKQSPDAFREHLVRVLDWEDAHVGFDKWDESIAGFRAARRALGIWK